MFDAAVVTRTVDFLAKLAGGRTLEFGIGQAGSLFRSLNAAYTSTGSSCQAR
jgi:hypothetical protein